MKELNNTEWLQKFYTSLCDGDWEHSYGFNISNIDNPGWMINFDLCDTQLENKPFSLIKEYRTDDNWLFCRVTGKVFEGRCGPKNLDELLSIFRCWADSDGTL